MKYNLFVDERGAIYIPPVPISNDEVTILKILAYKIADDRRCLQRIAEDEHKTFTHVGIIELS